VFRSNLHVKGVYCDVRDNVSWVSLHSNRTLKKSGGKVGKMKNIQKNIEKIGMPFAKYF
jgi:hypothetical protein